MLHRCAVLSTGQQHRQGSLGNDMTDYSYILVHTRTYALDALDAHYVLPVAPYPQHHHAATRLPHSLHLPHIPRILKSSFTKMIRINSISRQRHRHQLSHLIPHSSSFRPFGRPPFYTATSYGLPASTNQVQQFPLHDILIHPRPPIGHEAEKGCGRTAARISHHSVVLSPSIRTPSLIVIRPTYIKELHLLCASLQ